MARLFSALGTSFVAIGFIGAPLAAFSTFVLYVLVTPTRGQVNISVAIGVIVAVLAAAALLAIYSRRYQTASDVNPGEYRDLNARLRLARHLFEISPTPAQCTGVVLAARSTAEELVKELVDDNDPRKGLLNQAGAGWLAGEGYLEAWADIYGLEESLVLLVPVQQVTMMANDDRFRLEGSNIPNWDALKKRLDWDVGLLSPPMPDAAIGKDELSARVDIQAVRRQINRYRSEQWAALIAERNRTLLAAALAAVLAYLGLLSVVVWRIDTKALLVAVSFVVTGALVSLLHQVTMVGTPDAGIEDFGQSTARLLAATSVSGLVALIGIIVLEGATLTVNGVPLLTAFPHWKETFDWTANKSAFFFAALFGAAPSLLFDLLQKRADGIKNNLDSSQATGATSKK